MQGKGKCGGDSVDVGMAVGSTVADGLTSAATITVLVAIGTVVAGTEVGRDAVEDVLPQPAMLREKIHKMMMDIRCFEFMMFLSQ